MVTVLGFFCHNSNDSGVKNNFLIGSRYILFNSSELANIPSEMCSNSWGFMHICGEKTALLEP